MALLKCTDGSVLAFLKSKDGFVLALLKSTDGSILAPLKLPSIFSCQNSTVGEFWCTMVIMQEKQHNFLFIIECCFWENTNYKVVCIVFLKYSVVLIQSCCCNGTLPWLSHYSDGVAGDTTGQDRFILRSELVSLHITKINYFRVKIYKKY